MPEVKIDSLSSKEIIDNFQKMSEKGLWLKRYHADWCGHCQSMQTEWDKFVKSHEDSPVQIASIEDAAIQKMSVRPNNLLGFPSIHLYKDGNFISEFNGERTSEKMSEFLKLFSSLQSGGSLSKKKKIRIKRAGSKKKNKKNKKSKNRKRDL